MPTSEFYDGIGGLRLILCGKYVRSFHDGVFLANNFLSEVSQSDLQRSFLRAG